MTSKKQVYFLLLVASANAVVVLSDFDNWKQQSLRQQKKGLWTMWTGVLRMPLSDRR